ncbi:MAG: hypothetical protein HYV16_05695 [Gammaproteobacteria bacterium]|nr:hypothetical protein [Gammaproteobacteria bacterium]
MARTCLSWSSLLSVCFCLAAGPVLAGPNPLERALAEPTLVSAESRRLSAWIGAPVLLLAPADYREPARRERLLDALGLASAPRERYRRALARAGNAGFMLRPLAADLPCLLAVEGSYDERALAPHFVDLLGDYPYQAYRGRPALYTRMVLYHELGHCFETESGPRSEAFADVFAMLVLACEDGPDGEALPRQVLSRLLALAEGDTSHYSLPALAALRAWRAGLPGECDSGADLLQLSRDIVGVAASRPPPELARSSLYLALSLALYFDAQNLAVLDRDTRDAAEALREAVMLREARHRARKQDLDEAQRPGDAHAQEQLALSLAQAMYDLRRLNDDLYNPVQLALFRREVEDLYRVLGLRPEAPSAAEDSDEIWLAKLRRRPCLGDACAVRP